MGQLWSTIASMIGPDIDDRDLRLAVRMVHDHHAEIVNAKNPVNPIPVPWSRRAHINAVFALNRVRTEWDHIEEIFENVPLTTHHALDQDGTLSMLEEIRDFQDDPNSLYEYDTRHHDIFACWICSRIALWDDDRSLTEGPIGLARWQARNPTLESRRPTRQDLHGRSTGHGQSRRVPHMYNPNP